MLNYQILSTVGTTYTYNLVQDVSIRFSILCSPRNKRIRKVRHRLGDLSVLAPSPVWGPRTAQTSFHPWRIFSEVIFISVAEPVRWPRRL